LYGRKRADNFFAMIRRGARGVIKYRLYLIPVGLIFGYLIMRAVLTFTNKQPDYHGTVIDPPILTEDFSLQTEAGEVHLSDFHGKNVLLYFGYTFCPDVCPLTLAKIAQVKRDLGEGGDKIQILFISIDPERDTPQVLGNYARAFQSAFVAGTESPEKIAGIAKEFGIYYQKAPPEAGESGYSIEHTSVIWVIDAQGNKRLLWQDDLEPAEMASDLKRLVREE
jgi:protein SCO1